MTPDRMFTPNDAAKNALIDNDGYQKMYADSVDPDAFWAEHGKRVDWIKILAGQ